METRASNEIAQAREWLAAARSVVVLTGAGISAESGLPTFRGPGGLWRNFRPEQLATPEAFHRDPKLVWEWYDWRRSVHAKCEPNPGHHALVELERRRERETTLVNAKEQFLLVTQNVDSLHERAGSRNIIHLHGSLWRIRCLKCGKEEANEQVPLVPLPPHCACGGMQRPAVVWFGEALPRVALEHGARVIEVNPEPTDLSSSADLSLRGLAGEILPQLV